ncbi:MAG: alanine--tRNA ligase [Ruminococcaceae bacterium]|nr:alanine--tRNA ligase [Oscillospiraceae bacterium]
MKKFGTNELRELFLQFFESKGHLRLPSFPLIPDNDPSLLLINSGMAPMKPYFTGEKEPPAKRVCTCQKCVRTGDIENIGKTDRHGTFFEMLGNFSFGDYFKHEAIAWSWEFLTSEEWCGLDPNLLYPSVYEDDDEAFAIWRDEIGIPENRIYRFGKADNFWEHGSGACGPCSEVYFDRGKEHGCEREDCEVGCECDRYIEVWNNVFSQFNSDGKGNYTELASKNIDTGMGLERLACVCQGVNSLFDIDTIKKITEEVSRITGAIYGQDHKTDVSLRVITDHIRSASFMIADGILPSNEGRGYVLRRLIRRAARHGKLLGMHGAFLYKICDTVISENGSAYTELKERETLIKRVIQMEEESFAHTIDSGIGLLNELISEMKEKGNTQLCGQDAFKLYDTYGFPLDLTEDILEEHGFNVDTEGFNEHMEAQRAQCRAARGNISGWSDSEDIITCGMTEFVGYESLVSEAKITAIVSSNESCSVISTGESGIIVLNQSTFYAEMGGQVSDVGTISNDEGVFEVSEVKKDSAGHFLHSGTVISGSFTLGQTVKTNVDKMNRAAIMRAHSATHLLHSALREVLGDHVHQSGSLVMADRLRFDFTHFAAMTEAEIKSVTKLINRQILGGKPVETAIMSQDEAKAKGAQALFGEKYGDRVRVVSMGEFSSELCGGTHVDNIAKIGPFKIISEASIASGIRRIEAVTGQVYFEEEDKINELISTVAEIFKVPVTSLPDKAKSAIKEIKELKIAADSLRDKLSSGEISNLLLSAKTVGDLKVLTIIKQDISQDELRKLGDFIKDKAPEIVAVLAGVTAEKFVFLTVCGKTAVEKGIKAGEIVRKVSEYSGGKGGGRPDFAMGGGTDLTKLQGALELVTALVKEKLGI